MPPMMIMMYIRPFAKLLSLVTQYKLCFGTSKAIKIAIPNAYSPALNNLMWSATSRLRLYHHYVMIQYSFWQPQHPCGKTHLCIGKKIICHNILSNLWLVVSTRSYRSKLQKKHNWLLLDFENINWASFHATLKPFKQDDQQWIILFINGKLPLQASKAHPHHGSPYVHHANVNKRMHNTSLNADTQNGTRSSLPLNILWLQLPRNISSTHAFSHPSGLDWSPYVPIPPTLTLPTRWSHCLKNPYTHRLN